MDNFKVEGTGFVGQSEARKVIISSSHYRINYHQVPKVGSKLMTRLFEINSVLRPVNTKSFKNKHVDNDYISIALVRNPYDRVASIYKYFYLTLRNATSPMALFGRECGSFEEFVKEVIVPSTDSKETNNHLLSQSWYLCPNGSFDVDRLYDLNDLNNSSEFKRLMRVPNDYQFEAVNSSKGSINWTTELRDLVYQRYKDDFLYLAYPRTL